MMFVVFKGGTPIRMGNCSEANVSTQAKEGEEVILWDPVNGNPLDWRLVDGELVRNDTSL